MFDTSKIQNFDNYVDTFDDFSFGAKLDGHSYNVIIYSFFFFFFFILLHTVIFDHYGRPCYWHFLY